LSHSALNAVLFPPLFFFSSLYYTDIASTLSVMVYYIVFLQKSGRFRASVIGSGLQVLLASASLMFRQTNIFWVAIAPLLLEIVSRIDQAPRVVRDSMHQRSPGFGDTITSVLRTSWKYGAVYSPPTNQAHLDGESPKHSQLDIPI
jgi:alpha-1,2-glucosyltransferase